MEGRDGQLKPTYMALSARANLITGPATASNFATTDPGFQPKALLVWNGMQNAAVAVASAQFNLGAAVSNSTEIAVGYNSLDNAASSDVVRTTNDTAIIRTFNPGTTTVNISSTFNTFGATGFTLTVGTVVLASPLLNYLALGGADITNTMSGNFIANTSTGNQAVTGIGFEPDVLFLFFNVSTTSGVQNNNYAYSFGVTDGVNQWAIGVGAQNAQATKNNRRCFSNDHVAYQPAAVSDTMEASATIVSFDSDGFTINWDDAPGQADIVGYMAVKGGSWKVGTDTQKTSTGTKATTGVGFTPQGVLFGSVCDTNINTVTPNARLMIGAATSGTNCTLWNGDRDNVATSIANSKMSSTKSLIMATEGTSATPTTQAEAAISSFDSDGFTLDWTTADATARNFGYVAFGDTPVPANTNSNFFVFF